MSIIGNDDRTQVANANLTMGNFANVVAVDSPTGTGAFLAGSGYLIGPQHVLTAGHVVSTTSATSGVVPNTRVTTSGNVSALPSRSTPPSAIPNASFNVTNWNFIDNYNGGRDTDIALLTTTANLTTPAAVLGLLTFVDPTDADGLPIATAGYPKGAGSPDPSARTMYTSSGTIATASSNGRFTYSNTVDTQGGQSGSGVWVDVSALPANSFLSSATADLVVGVHTHGGSSNGGHLIEKANYHAIIAQMFMDAGSAAAAQMSASQLPENVIVGTEPGFFSFLTGSGDDTIIGSYRKELIIGRGGDDLLLGGGADDRLEGGDGVDQALFSDIFTNYDFTITDPSNPAFEFNHARGSQSDGKDTTKDIEFGIFEFVDADKNGNDDDGNLFFVPLQVDPDDNTKLKDGPEITPEEDILDDEGNKIGTITVESPAWMFDGDVNYTLTIGSEQGILFNFAYIIDTSGSIAGTPLAQAKAAYQALTQSLIDDGIADNSEFGVVDFDSSGRLFAPLSASATISTINGLSAGGLTNFNSALTQALSFFNSPARNNNATNIAYFLSDGRSNTGGSFSASAAALQNVAEVRAFGIGDSVLAQLNIVDSDSAVLLTNPADLITEFNAAIIDRDTIERIDVKSGGSVIDTIAPGQLVEDTLGLQFEGTIDGLEVTRTAENEITFDLVFNNGTPTASLDYKITTGQEQVTDQTDNGTKEVIIFSVNQSDFTDSAETSPLVSQETLVSTIETAAQNVAQNQLVVREIIGNDLDNVIEVRSGENTIFGNGGNDRFILLGGINLVDGGEGIDTIEINKTQAEVGGVSKSGNVVNIGSDNTAINVEFLEFSDVRLAVDTLTALPILSLRERAILTPEGDTSSTITTFTVDLSSISTQDVVINFASRSSEAIAGIDFVENIGQLTIAAGESSGDITLEILGDNNIEGDEAVFLDLTLVSGGTFANGTTTETIGVQILDDDSVITVPITGDDPTVIEGDPNAPSILVLTLDRFGGLNGSDTIGVEIIAAGDNPAQASDLVNGFSSSQVTFAPGDESKTIDISINPDLDLESDETFGIKLTRISGGALVPDQPIVYTIINDDTDSTQPNVINGTSGRDDLTGTDEDDIITGGKARDSISTGDGNDLLIYNSIVDAGDKITDFEVGKDKIVLSELLESFNLGSSDAFADGYLQLVGVGSSSLITVDTDGTAGSGRARPFILVQDVTVDQLNNPANFVL